MNYDQQTLLLIKGTIADLSKADRLQVEDAARRLRQVLSFYPLGHAQVALALVGAEATVKANG